MTMNDEEYRVVTEAIERAERDGGNLIMPESETQQDDGLEETLDEDLLLNDQKSEKNDENDFNNSDNGTAVQIDLFGSDTTKNCLRLKVLKAASLCLTP